MNAYWKSVAKSVGETLLYVYSCLAAYNLLQHFNIIGELSFFQMLVVWVFTFVGGDFLIARNDEWMLKRRIMKTAREVAKFQGIDPKSLKYDDIKITTDENGVMDIEITIQGEIKK